MSISTNSRSAKQPSKKPIQERPWRALLGLFIILAALVGTLGVGQWKSDADFVPDLALDLQGGTQIILTPKTTDGSEVSESDVDQAIEIIRKRVDASGVTEAEITSQGGQNVVVALAGNPSEETLDLVRTPAQLSFRPVLVMANPTPTEVKADGDGDGKISDEPATKPENGSDPAWITEAVQEQFGKLDCTLPESLKGHGDADPNKAMVTCSVEGHTKYILGPVEMAGTDVASASSGMGHDQLGHPDGKWGVDLSLNSEGTAKFREITQRLASFRATDPTRNLFAIVLDGLVVSSPGVENAIPNGLARISGSFDAQSAANLANQLNFGALPLNFEVQSEETISATLGSEQLSKSILFGLVGLALVVVYLALQYRGLSLIATGSLVAAAALTYLIIALFSWWIGYRLSLPGVAGIIVSVGVTADSFIVYFERIRDEIRDGRTIPQAVSHAWRAARRTILISDVINLLAAVVLYFLAVGGVRGFAFTLGLTTVVDLIVVFMFTHPAMLLAVRKKFFAEGHKLSGLNPEWLGAKSPVYTGRGTTRAGIARRKAEAASAKTEIAAAGAKEEN
ncbi:MAG: protein translocase subunit SecD [Buchananella hordeovulneris]|nr:protein translocase subunit SecD [Buchananella hordeovulneris]